MEMEDVALVELFVEIYVKDKKEPLWAPTTFQFSISDPPADVEEMTDIATTRIIEQMDKISHIFIIFESAKHSKVIVMRDSIQSVHIQAPDEMPAVLTLAAEMEDEDFAED